MSNTRSWDILSSDPKGSPRNRGNGDNKRSTVRAAGNGMGTNLTAELFATPILWIISRKGRASSPARLYALPEVKDDLAARIAAAVPFPIQPAEKRKLYELLGHPLNIAVSRTSVNHGGSENRDVWVKFS